MTDDESNREDEWLKTWHLIGMALLVTLPAVTWVLWILNLGWS